MGVCIRFGMEKDWELYLKITSSVKNIELDSTDVYNYGAEMSTLPTDDNFEGISEEIPAGEKYKFIDSENTNIQGSTFNLDEQVYNKNLKKIQKEKI